MYSNTLVINHISDGLRSKFQERFACFVSMRVAALCRGTSWRGKALWKSQLLRKFLLMQSYSTLCLAQPRATSSFCSQCLFKDNSSLLSKGERKNIEEMLAEKIKLPPFTWRVLQSLWLVTVTLKTISRQPVQSFPSHWRINTPIYPCTIQLNHGQNWFFFLKKLSHRSLVIFIRVLHNDLGTWSWSPLQVSLSCNRSHLH